MAWGVISISAGYYDADRYQIVTVINNIHGDWGIRRELYVACECMKAWEGERGVTASQPARQQVPLNISPAAARSMAIVRADQHRVCVCVRSIQHLARHHPSINRLENISRSLLAEPTSGYEKHSGGQIRFK